MAIQIKVMAIIHFADASYWSFRLPCPGDCGYSTFMVMQFFVIVDFGGIHYCNSAVQYVGL